MPPPTLFLSYARPDESLRDQLEVHHAGLKAPCGQIHAETCREVPCLVSRMSPADTRLETGQGDQAGERMQQEEDTRNDIGNANQRSHR